MPKVTPAQVAFNAGEFSPLMLGRVDFSKYKSALARCWNSVVLTQGPVIRRPGTKYVVATKDSATASRLLRFEFSTEQVYFIEIGHEYFRFCKDHGQIESSGSPVAPTTDYGNAGGQGDRTASIAVSTNIVWDGGTSNNLVDGATGDNTTDSTNTPGVGAGVISDGDYVEFDFGSNVYVDELTIAQSAVPTNGSWQWLGSDSSGTGFTAYGGTTWNSATQVVSAAGVPATGHRYWRWQKSGAGTWTNSWLREFTFKIAPGAAPGGSGPVEVTTTYTEDEIWDMKFTQSADTLYIFHPAHPPAKLTRTSHTAWTLSEMTTEDGPWMSINTTATTLQCSATTGSVTVTASSATGINDGQGFLATDVGRQIRIKTSGAAYGWGRITARASATSVTMTVIQAIGATTATATWRLGLWSETTGYPRAGTFFEDRLVTGGTDTGAQTLAASRTGNYQNFAPTAYDTNATVADDNGFTFTLNSRDVQVIRWLIGDEKGLLVGTYSGEWVLRASTTGQALSPSNVTAKQTSRYGSNKVQAIQAGKATLFVQKSGRKLREFAYDYAIDGFRAPNMSILSDHLMLAGVVDMDFQSEPHSILWAVRSDGALLSFTYDREQNEFGWSWSTLGGIAAYQGGPAIVESVACGPAPDGTRDEVWLIVRRYINGQVVRYIEYMEKFWEVGTEQEDSYYLDCGGTYDGSPTTTITAGLDHLINETLSCIVDGAAHPDVTVDSNGHIELTREGSKIQIGYGYRSQGECLRFEAGSANGTAQGKVQRINKVTFRVLDTLGLKVGPDFDNMDLVPDTFRTLGDDLGVAVPLYTGDAALTFDGSYTTHARICWEFDQPFPGNILLITPELDTQD